MTSHKLLGVRVDSVTMAETLEYIDQYIASRAPHQLVTVNPEFIIKAREDRAFRRVINNSSLAVPDGIGVIVMGKITGHPFKERVTGADLTAMLAEQSARKGWKIFLLGAAEGVAAETGRRLQAQHPGLNICGTYAGSPDQEDQQLLQMLKDAAPDILLVAYGAPKQDLWISRYQQVLHVPVAIGVGGTFDFIAGVSKRAPRLVQHIGLEWLWRLIQEPRRWKRMLALPKFAFLTLGETLGLVRSI